MEFAVALMLIILGVASPIVATGNNSFAGNGTFRIAFALVSIGFGIFLAIRKGRPLTQM